MSRQVKSTLAVVAARSLDNSFITHTRASSATRTNDIGLVEVVGSGNIRLDFDSSPTTAGRQLGWLLEGYDVIGHQEISYQNMVL